MILLQIYQWVCQQKNFKSLLTFGEVMSKILMSSFLTHGLVHEFSEIYNNIRVICA